MIRQCLLAENTVWHFLSIMHHHGKVSCKVNYHANIKYYKRKNAQPVASCQQAWTMLCCTTWTLLTSLLTNYSIVQLSILVKCLSNNENNREQACFFNIVSPVPTIMNNRFCFINAEQHCSTNNYVKTFAIFSYVDPQVVTFL